MSADDYGWPGAMVLDLTNGWPPLPTITMPDGQKRIAAPDGAAWLSLVIKLGLS